MHQSLYYPVIDAGQDTDSYREFADGPYLTAKAMAWFWDAYTPDPAQRAEITASPLRASLVVDYVLNAAVEGAAAGGGHLGRGPAVLVIVAALLPITLIGLHRVGGVNALIDRVPTAFAGGVERLDS
ncbi:alpha/beta hydrolase fold domain-containing protein [Nonomuraea sp. NPDC001831]|uniref:alpha/beta hydrolase fold domain-containing protein n=1 Tax=Nonomuraea sp. NPDC001831 TaxID=3364340 RepID=UPI0036CC141C